MMATMDIVQFLTARIDEDEQVVRAALTEGADLTWSAYRRREIDDPATAEHIARYDPARVLREVEAKRRIVDAATLMIDQYAGGMLLDYVWQTLRLLALPYSDNPDYRKEWKP